MLNGWPSRIALAALVLLASVGASNGAQAGDNGQIKLTRDHITHFLAAYPKVRAVGLVHAAKDGNELSKADDPLSTLVRLGSDEGLKSEVEAVVKEHGFSGIKEWFKVSQNIALAYAAIKKPSDAKISAEVEKGVAQIEKNKFLPADTNKKMIQEIRKGAEKAGLLNQPKENVDLVREMKADIDAVVVSNLN
jgi:hypothetical protein